MASYSAVIDLRVNGEKKIDSVVAKVNRINGLIRGLKPVPDIFQKQRGGTEAFRNQINALKQTLSETLATFGQTGKITGFSKTIGGLNSQLAAFRSVANSAKAGSQQFTQALTAGENASRQLLKAELERLKSLQNLYQTNAKLVKGSSAGIGKQLTEVLKIGNTIPKTTAALNNYKMELERIISLVEIGSKEYKELEVAIANVNKQLDRTKPVKTQTDKKLGVEKKVTDELSKQKQLEMDLFKQRRKNIRDRERTAKQQRQGRLLGAGFPLLFGGGLGAVGGSLAGSFLAKPGEEFGAQIFGSAVGQQLETLIKRANALGDAVREISFEKLEEQSILINGELRAQIELLKELGEADKARAALAEEVEKRTGASADVSRDINRQVQLLNGGFSELVNSAGTTLGILAGPFLTAIGAISFGLASSFKTFNNFASTVRNLIPNLKPVDKFFERFDKNLQKSTAEAKKLKRELNFEINLQDQLFKLQQQQKVGREGKTIEGQKFNFQLKREEAIVKDSEARRKALANVKNDDVRAKINEKFNNKLKNDLAKINQQENLIVETQNEKVQKLLRVVDLKTHENGITEKISKANREDDVKTVARLEFERDKVNLQFALGEKLREAKDLEEAIAIIKVHQTDIDKLRLVLAEKLNSETDRIKDAFEAVGETINNDMKEGIKGLIKGTGTLSDMLNNIADRFLDVALNQALFGSVLGSAGEKGGGLFGALGLFANGGRPPVGKPSIVGEKGPELFVPRSSGTIVPNNKLGGGGSTSVVVNVDASGTDVQGDEAQAKELGTLISVAVRGELLKQQRPGGLLSSLR